MPVKPSAEIRQDFFNFFREKEHAIVPSAPVVPQEDPTLLFTNAGMNQFKPIFLGEQDSLKFQKREWHRAADTQRCIRVSGKHNDLEEVGYDTYHHTLFEMLGNWSFGDYFKKEAIAWAWELLVDVWDLNPDRLYATVFGGDEEDGLPIDKEAADLWRSETNIHPDHILPYGKKDNFWEMGETGPCGPCSEIHVDLRSDEERAKQDGKELVNADDPRVMEIWNLVFIQFNRQADSSLKQLPAQHVDTGMGFERICAVLQGKTSNYDTDVFTPIIAEISKISGIEYGAADETDIAMRVIADHIRAVSFSIADGANPGNDGRGYVVRRILRRAIRYGWDKLELKDPFMYKLVDVLANQFADVFPVLKSQQHFVENVIHSEEKSFLKTLGQGIELFHEMVEGKETLSGKDAFKLHDTYGFPIDLTQLMAREHGIEVDTEGFEAAMKEQKDRARAAGKFNVDLSGSSEWTWVSDKKESEFVGYDETEVETNILALKKEGDRALILLEQTPFYAESGGQVADTGILTNGDEYIKVVNVQKSEDGNVHVVESLPENPEGIWTASLDVENRRETEKHHSATHLVHAALRDTLGTHVAQKGSLVAPDRLRFDFSHYDALTQKELDKIEEIVNTKIQENIPLKEERNISFDQAKKSGAMMLFGEKYGDSVRIITFDDDFSKELCGGTHVNATGKIGYFRFVHEGSAASGIRRIEAVAGKAADQLLREEKHTLDSVKSVVGQTDDLIADISGAYDRVKQLEKQLEQMKLKQAGSNVDQLIAQPETIADGILLATGIIDGADMDLLKQLGYRVHQKVETDLITVLGTKDDKAGKVYLMATVSENLFKEKGLKAGDLVGKIARLVGGGGGGQPTLATAGGRKPEELESALEKAKELILEQLGK
jgi:alanyl-tRNA synthetase